MNRASAKTAPTPTPPSKVVEFPAGGWLSTWKGRPTKPTLVGLRTISASYAGNLRAKAERHAWKMHPRPESVVARDEAYNDMVCEQLVAAGVCRADDESAPLIPIPDMNTSLAFTPQGIRFLYEELEAYAEEACPSHPKADAAELAELAMHLLPLEALVEAALQAAEDIGDVPMRARLVAARLLAAPPEAILAGKPSRFASMGGVGTRILKRMRLALEDVRSLLNLPD